MVKFVIYELFLFFTIASCNSYNENKEEMSIKVIVQDASTGKPIHNAKVVALCWKESGFEIDDVDYLKKEGKTDQNGVFSIKLERKYLKVDIASNSNSYKPKAISLNDFSSPLVIKLERFNSKEPAEMDFNEDGRISVRVYSSHKEAEVWGFNLSEGVFTNDKDKADIWLGQNNVLKVPEVVSALGKGGIIPIFKQKASEALQFSFTEAPLVGYLDTYKLTGKEQGLFVRTRDGKSYGKIIFSGTYESTEPTEKGPFKEVGRRFSYIFQKNGSPDLNVSPTVDLEEYILKEI